MAQRPIITGELMSVSIDKAKDNFDELYGRTAYVKDYGAVGDGITDDTTAIQNAIDSGVNQIIINDGTYLITHSTLTLQDGQHIHGNGTLKNTQSTTSGINNSEYFFIRVGTENKVSNLNFEGVDNTTYAVAGISDATNDCDNIIVENITTYEAGIFIAEPANGFTYNRHDETFVSWYENGQVTSVHKSSNIKVLNCTMFGDTAYTVALDNFGSRVSGVVFHYVENGLAKNITASNVRFGAWSYGGASRNSASTDITTIATESQNIVFDNIVGNETFSPVWMSKTDKGIITNCMSNIWKDVAVDFEGCTNSLASNNIMITSNVTTGGGLTALNRCENIIFSNNVLNVNKTGSSVLIRDGNDKIYYYNNTITSSVAGGKIKVWNDLSGISEENTNITIDGNSFNEFAIDIQEGATKFTVKNNSFYSAVGAASIVKAADCTDISIISNLFRFESDYASTGQANSVIQVVKGGATNTAYNTIITGNKLPDVTGDTGILIFIDSTTSGEFNNIVCTDNIVPTIYIDDDFINVPANGTKARVVWNNNFSSVSDTEHTPATSLKRLNDTEKFSPTVLIGATGVGSLTGTYKIGDRIYNSAPTSGNLGWVCTVAGTPGTWVVFG